MKFEKAEKKRLKLMASYARGKVIDIGYNQQPNPYLKCLDGMDIDFNKVKPINYEKIFDSFEDVPSNVYDSVLVGELFEHLENPGIFLDHCNRILKHNGLLILSTENPLFFVNIFGDFTLYKIKFNTESEHIALYSVKRMIFQFNRHGFRLKRTIGCGIEFPLIDYTFPTKISNLSKRIVYVALKVNGE